MTHDSPRRWTAEETSLVVETAERTWSAIERARAEAALRASEERQAFLLRLSDALRPLTDPVAVRLTATQLLGEQLGVNRTFYADADNGNWLVAKGFETGVDPLPDQPFVMSAHGAWIIDAFRAGRRLIVNDVHTDPRFQEPERAANLGLQIGAALAVPLLRNGELVAMLVAHSVRPREWSAQDVDMLEETAERTASRERCCRACSTYSHKVSRRADAPNLVWDRLGPRTETDRVARWLHQRDERGTRARERVHISLPIPADVPTTVAARLRPAVQHVTRKVVVIDDNVDAAVTLAMLIGHLGGEARVAHDGRAGLRAVSEFRPDVVFLDIGMSEMDGYEVCQRLRGESFGADLFVVALTGWGQLQDKQRHCRLAT